MTQAGLDVGIVAGDRAGSTDDDVATAGELSLGHVRLTIPWATAQPRPGSLDGGVIEEVRAASGAAHGLGLKVWVALLAPAVPRWFDDEGGFTDASTTARWWPRWVQAVADAVGDEVDGWVPIEAPFALAARLVPSDPRRHGEVVDTLCVAWRDAWRILRGPAPVATSLDVRPVNIPRDDPEAAAQARRVDHLRWHTWLRALRDGTITIPGRADRELADLAGACDVLGIATSGGAGADLEPLVHRCADEGPDRPLAIVFRPTGADPDARAEAAHDAIAQVTRLRASLPVERLTLTDVQACARAVTG